jgi:hypothetical protein
MQMRLAAKARDLARRSKFVIGRRGQVMHFAQFGAGTTQRTLDSVFLGVFTKQCGGDPHGQKLMDNVGVKRNDLVSDDKLVLRPLIGLMHGREPSEIEQFVVEELEKHRRLRDEAVRLEAMLETSASDGDQYGDIDRAYVTAMIAVHAQQTVVSTLLDILGYVPETLKAKSH